MQTRLTSTPAERKMITSGREWVSISLWETMKDEKVRLYYRLYFRCVQGEASTHGEFSQARVFGGNYDTRKPGHSLAAGILTASEENKILFRAVREAHTEKAAESCLHHQIT